MTRVFVFVESISVATLCLSMPMTCTTLLAQKSVVWQGQNVTKDFKPDRCVKARKRWCLAECVLYCDLGLASTCQSVVFCASSE